MSTASAATLSSSREQIATTTATTPSSERLSRRWLILFKRTVGSRR